MSYPTEKQLPIVLTIGRDGLHITISVTSSLDAIPAMIDRLKVLGIVDLVVKPAAPPSGTSHARPAAQEPLFNGDGDACCPIHAGRKLRGPNQWGKLYCTAKDGDAYCKYSYKAE